MLGRLIGVDHALFRIGDEHVGEFGVGILRRLDSLATNLARQHVQSKILLSLEWIHNLVVTACLRYLSMSVVVGGHSRIDVRL